MENIDILQAQFLRRRAYYRGRAKVWLSDIRCELYSVDGGKSLHSKKQSDLLKTFEQVEILREEPQNFIPVTVEASVLQDVLRTQNVSDAELSDHNGSPPWLEFQGQNTPLTALHGKEYIKCARSILQDADAWWIVDLYDAAIDEESRYSLRTLYPIGNVYADGDVFRHYRTKQLQHDDSSAHKWLARLSSRKRQDLKTLRTKHLDLQDAFDGLLGFCGLWIHLQLGTFHRLLTINCDKELVCYLTHIQSTWRFILGDNDSSNLDPQTVEILHTLVPGLSSQDASEAERAMSSGQLFPSILSLDVRDAIMKRIMTIRVRVPSIYTFLEDTKYLEVCATAVKLVLPHGTRSQLSDYFQRCFRSDRKYPVEIEEDKWIDIDLTGPDLARLSYLQLWLFVWRKWPYLQPENPRKDAGETRQEYEVKDTIIHELATLASRLGFQNAAIRTLLENDPLHCMVSAFIETARPRSEYQIDNRASGDEIRRMSQFLHDLQRLDKSRSEPQWLNDKSMVRAERCGRPFNLAYLNHSQHLFLNTVYGCTPPSGIATSALLAQRDTFISFFGHLSTQYEALWPNSRNDDDSDRISDDHYSVATGYSPSEYSINGSYNDNNRSEQMETIPNVASDLGSAMEPTEVRSEDMNRNTQLETTSYTALDDDLAVDRTASRSQSVLNGLAHAIETSSEVHKHDHQQDQFASSSPTSSQRALSEAAQSNDESPRRSDFNEQQESRGLLKIRKRRQPTQTVIETYKFGTELEVWMSRVNWHDEFTIYINPVDGIVLVVNKINEEQYEEYRNRIADDFWGSNKFSITAIMPHLCYTVFNSERLRDRSCSVFVTHTKGMACDPRAASVLTSILLNKHGERADMAQVLILCLGQDTFPR